MSEGISVHYGEIALKGKLRSKFEKILVNNIRYTTGYNSQVVWNRLLIESRDWNAMEALSITPGIAWVGKYVSINRNISDLEENLKEILQKYDQRINLDVKRIDKSFESTSLELKQKLTKDMAIQISTTRPKVQIEIMKDSYIINYDITRGIGGVPSGSAGKVISLFSGGIDSAVAPFEMMKRGCTVDLLHVYAVAGSPQVLDTKVGELARRLSLLSPLKLYMVPFYFFNLKVISINPRYELVMFKRFLLKLAEELCSSYGYKGIATGDSLSQVASQTLDNISSISYGIDVPVFRPLLSHNKEEIINKAKIYGTYDTSIKAYKDCCSLVSKKPLTMATMEKVSEFEKKLDLDGIVRESLSKLNVESFDYRAEKRS